MMTTQPVENFLSDNQLRTRLERCNNLPSPPGIALRVIDLVQDPDVNMSKVSELVSVDPALAAKILRIANSPMYARRRKIENLHQAIVLLGLDATLTLALSFSLVSSLRDEAAGNFDYEHYWKRSIAAATCSRCLGAHIKAGSGEELFLAGLLQDIGMLAINKADPDHYRNLGVSQSNHIALSTREQEVLGADHAAIGGWLLQQWRLPPRLQTAVAASHNLEQLQIREDWLPFVQCVSVSGPLVDILESEQPEQACEFSIKLAEERLGISAEALEAILEDLEADMKESESLFDLDLKDFILSASLLEQARETLMVRNLQNIQQTSELNEAARTLESRTRDLEEKSRHDGLTGLLNRTYFDERFNDDFKVAQKQGWPITVMFLDLDHFKKVNDTYGHQAGDEILQHSAKILDDATRDEDIVARYGGEEFIIVLPGYGENAALIIAERIVSAFRSTTHPLQGQMEISITASIGVAVHGEGVNFEDTKHLISAADIAVYAAKQQGRDRHVVYSGELEEQPQTVQA